MDIDKIAMSVSSISVDIEAHQVLRYELNYFHCDSTFLVWVYVDSGLVHTLWSKTGSSTTLDLAFPERSGARFIPVLDFPLVSSAGTLNAALLEAGFILGADFYFPV
jgi:hypothetical protein